METLKSCDMPKILAKPNRNLVLPSGSFCQTAIKQEMAVWGGRSASHPLHSRFSLQSEVCSPAG